MLMSPGKPLRGSICGVDLGTLKILARISWDFYLRRNYDAGSNKPARPSPVCLWVKLGLINAIVCTGYDLVQSAAGAAQQEPILCALGMTFSRSHDDE